MSSTETTTPKFTAPILFEDLPTLFRQEEIFTGHSQAENWLRQFGSEVLKDPALDIVHNLITATSDDRRNRGLITLERAILAQAAWLQLFDLMAPAGRFMKLKELTDAVRSNEATPEEHAAAKEAVLAAYVEYSERKQEVDPLIAKIVDLASETEFIFSARTGAIIGTGNRPMGLFPWQVAVLDAVLDDKGAREAPKSLRLTAERLEFLSRVHFGELPSRNGAVGSKKSGKTAKQAARAERDRQERNKRRGPGKGKG
jgi:hypothetical protein